VKSEDRQTAVAMLTTEHSTLQAARSSTVFKSNGRVSSYLATLSSVLLALSLLGTVTKFGDVFLGVAFVLGGMMVFIGVTTFLRVLEAAVEDALHGLGINRVRHFYEEQLPDLKPFFLQSSHDDIQSVRRDMALFPNHWQGLLSNAGLIGVMNSGVVAIMGYVVTELLFAPFMVTLIGTPVIFSAGLALHLNVQRRAWQRLAKAFPSEFAGQN
jgi:hypothetical protein